MGSLPPGSRQAATNAAREGFLAGFNDVLTLGGLLALWLVREREIEREPIETPAEGVVSPGAAA